MRDKKQVDFWDWNHIFGDEIIPALRGIFIFLCNAFMNQSEQDQILNIIKNLEDKKWYVPYFSDLASHETFGPVFTSLEKHEREEVNKFIDTYIGEKIEGMNKTKWGQLFKRFFESQPDLFWEFRDMNERLVPTPSNFQEIGQKVENEMFRLEGILTEKMIDQEKWLDKVVSSFYNIVYMFFPKMGEVGGSD